MIEVSLTVRCVQGHEFKIEGHDYGIRAVGYTRCPEPGCKRNAFTVKVTTQDDGSTLDDMQHLEAPATCPKCGHSLTGGKI